MILKRTKQLKTLFSDFVSYRDKKKKKKKKHASKNQEKAVLVRFQNPQPYHRFFYLLLKFYHLAGYTVYYPMGLSLYRNLRNKDRYMALLLKETNLLNINIKDLPNDIITITDSMFSEDYFKDYFTNDNRVDESFHVPMSFHPLMYHYELWNEKVHLAENRYNAIFCYGNFDKNAYLEIKRTSFKVAPRTELLNMLTESPDFVSISSSLELEDKKDILNKKIVFAMRENYQIEMKDIRSHLALFNFYLCCPGVVMPLCHNIAEAMSVGAIPVIEQEYAEVMYPNLRHLKNAVIFNDLNDLKILLQERLFTFTTDEIRTMRKNVLDYYQEFLSPTGMIKNLNENIANGNKIYLQAEHRSVKFKK
ncbi:glycosyltransferase family 47 protein [Chryseobacterium wangxinyae]|uniref:hypothetical protein n=1 Tax=Chryseobacterium sp. CY353 TaxID=2997334 RepID=UPI00226F9137|nr:hypothetical protein [Chryseobacterium sp. CY353]MCY0969563.1 hypothetical protein [Chryseobacterium sp. CY353]